MTTATLDPTAVQIARQRLQSAAESAAQNATSEQRAVADLVRSRRDVHAELDAAEHLAARLAGAIGQAAVAARDLANRDLAAAREKLRAYDEAIAQGHKRASAASARYHAAAGLLSRATAVCQQLRIEA